MLPKWHVLLGFLFSILFWILFPKINPLYILLVFLSSIFIDIDHYLNAVYKTGKTGIFHSFEYYKIHEKIADEEHKKGIRKKSDFQFLHTAEIHLIFLLLGLFLWNGFLYIFIGMFFHSLCDIAFMTAKEKLYAREFFFLNFFKEN